MNRLTDRPLIPVLALFALTASLAGCAGTPRYRWPQGFSGSYHQVLFGDVRPLGAEPLPIESAAESARPTESASLAAPTGIFYPPGLNYRTPLSRPTRFAVVPSPSVAR